MAYNFLGCQKFPKSQKSLLHYFLENLNDSRAQLIDVCIVSVKLSGKDISFLARSTVHRSEMRRFY